MIKVIIQMALLIVCGVVWRYLSRRQSGDKTKRGVLTELVYYLLLPALVLDALWTADLGIAAGNIALVAASGVLAGLGMAWLAYRPVAIPRTTRGALILAAGFPSATYLGLPVLQSALGDWARVVAVQYDLFACTPLLVTLGAHIAQAHGEDGASATGSLAGLLKVPPLWAAMLGVGLNASGLAEPHWSHVFLDRLASGVVPLMLVSLGMSLEWPRGQGKHVLLLFPALIIQLVLMPIVVWLLSGWLTFHPSQRIAVVLEAAMPSMLSGLIFCDRFRLNTPLYAAAVTLSTALSLITLPLWHRFLS